jgi:DNA primase small subunit
MQSKEWLKSDIIYEFDADELGLDVPVLNNIQWFDSSHLNEAKKQVFRLLDFIENDFGFSSGEAKINFSGKAGFHVHLRSEKIQSLNKRARIQLVDYLTAQNIDLVNLGFNFDSVPVACPLHSGLWAKRINSGILNFFNKNPKEISKLTGVAQRKFAFLLSNRQKIVDNMASGVLPPIDSKKNNEFWRKIIDFVVSVQRVPIDRQTSIDLHKIIRVPETLHGETGFLAKSLSVDELKEFDAFKDAVVFSSSPQVKISIPSAPKFYLNNESFGPFNNSTEELPLFAALYLIGKGAAVLVEK